MLGYDEMREQYRRQEESARLALDECVPKDYRPALGKHEAVNHASLKRVIAEAQEKCPDAAATIAWLLWHNVLVWQQMTLLSSADYGGSE